MLRFFIFGLAALTAFCPSALKADPGTVNLVVPGDLANVEGNANNSIPFDIGSLGLGSERYQQAYANSAFAGLAVGGGFITQISFRVDAAFWSFTNTLPDIQVNLSTTLQPVTGLSTTFSANVGADDRVVFPRGPMTLSGTGGLAVNPFDVTIRLTQPFFYNPALGNLLLDVRNYGGGSTLPFDATKSAGEGVGRQFTWLSGGVASSVADGSQASNSWGLVTQFTFAVPEPSSANLLAVGAASVLFRRRRASPA